MPAHMRMIDVDTDDDDAPEAVSLTQAKRTAKGRDGEVRAFAERERTKRKERNRARDGRLKARVHDAVVDGGDGSAPVQRDDEATDEDLGTDGNKGGLDLDAAGRDLDADDDVSGDDDSGEDNEDMEAGDLDEDMESDSDGDGDDVSDPSSMHLPDHLFAALSRPAPAPTPAPSKRAPSSEPRPRKRRSTRPKDVIVGGRTIRMLGISAQASAAYTLPPPKLARFAASELGLAKEMPSKERWKAKKAKSRANQNRYERRAVNVGVGKTSGPAARFATAVRK